MNKKPNILRAIYNQTKVSFVLLIVSILACIYYEAWTLHALQTHPVICSLIYCLAAWCIIRIVVILFMFYRYTPGTGITITGEKQAPALSLVTKKMLEEIFKEHDIRINTIRFLRCSKNKIIVNNDEKSTIYYEIEYWK